MRARRCSRSARSESRVTPDRKWMSIPQRILVVEDEMIVALFIEDLVQELGHEVAGTVSRLDEAMARGQQGDFDLAILDVHLHGQDVFPFAELLRDRGTPFIFA